MLPRTLKDFKVFVEGEGYVGLASEVTLPKVTKKKMEFFNSGMTAPIDVSVGYEKLEADITFSEPPTALMRLVTRQNVGDLQIRMVGDYIDPSNGNSSDVEIALTGCISEMDPGTLKRGENPNTKFMFAAVHYQYSDGGQTIFDIDANKPFPDHQ